MMLRSSAVFRLLPPLRSRGFGDGASFRFAEGIECGCVGAVIGMQQVFFRYLISEVTGWDAGLLWFLPRRGADLCRRRLHAGRGPSSRVDGRFPP